MRQKRPRTTTVPYRNENHSIIMIISLEWNRKLSMRFHINFGFGTITCTVCLRVRVCSLKFHFLLLFVRYNACSLNLFKSNIRTNTKIIDWFTFGLCSIRNKFGTATTDNFDGDWFIFFLSIFFCLIPFLLGSIGFRYVMLFRRANSLFNTLELVTVRGE